MKRNKPHAFLLPMALAICAMGQASFAPVATAQDTSQTQKVIKARFEVLHMLYQSLQVRSVSNSLELHTFTYSPAIRAKMLSILNAGGYQYGDKVEIWYKRGEDVAFNIKGKPSKPK